MRPIKTLLLFFSGFMLATVVGALLRVPPAAAQQNWNDLTIPRLPKPDAGERSVISKKSEDRVPPSADEPRTAADAPLNQQRLRGLPLDQAGTDSLKDAPADGRIETSEPLPVADGREEMLEDPRLPEDRAAFLSPPAGYDALAFQIELDPSTDARPRRFARFEPYTPTGQRYGSWVVLPTLEAGTTATSNVYKAPRALPDLNFDMRSTVLAVTDWQRHALQAKMTSVASGYQKYATENDKAYSFEMRGRLDVTSRANIEVLAAHSYDLEPRSSTTASTDASKRIPFVTDKFAFAINQRFNRLSLQLRGAVTESDYQPVPTYAGPLQSNNERDMTQRDAAIRAAWSFSPALSAFAELAGTTNNFKVLPVDGISRDSTGDRIRVGLAFGSASRIWRGEVATGYGHQRMRDGRLQNVEGTLIDANLAWRPTQLTSVLLMAKSDFVTSTQTGQGGATDRTFGVELRHSFLRSLNGVAGVRVQTTEYQGLPLREQTATAEIGGEYYISKATTLLARYSHAVVTSTAPNANTTTDAVRFGVRYQP